MCVCLVCVLGVCAWCVLCVWCLSLGNLCSAWFFSARLCLVFSRLISALCSACSSARLGLVGKILYQNRIGFARRDAVLMFWLVVVGGGVGVIISRESFLPSSLGRFWYLRSRLFATQMNFVVVVVAARDFATSPQQNSLGR